MRTQGEAEHSTSNINEKERLNPLLSDISDIRGKAKGKIINDLIKHLGLEISRISTEKIHTYDSETNISTGTTKEILKFFDSVPPFYDEGAPSPLQIQGIWEEQLLENRNNQIRYINENDVSAYTKMLDNMFYNELVNGLWNHGYYKSIEYIPKEFKMECELFCRLTNGEVGDLITNDVWSVWGHKVDEGVVTFKDPNNAIQAFNVYNIGKNIHKNMGNSINIADIGSGFGGMAEKLAIYSDIPINIFLLDIPLNLTTAYAYLTKIFPKKTILVSEPSQIEEIQYNNTQNFILVPTLFTGKISEEINLDIVHNSHSFSEMELNTVQWYINELICPEVNYIIETNSNRLGSTNVGGREEVQSREIPIPESHNLLMRFQDSEYDSRYVTSVYTNNNDR
jgi:hypothetical protein